MVPHPFSALVSLSPCFSSIHSLQPERSLQPLLGPFAYVPAPSLSVSGQCSPRSPQHGPAQPLGDPSLLQTRASPCYVQWCCFTLHLEVLDDAVALLYLLFLIMVVVRWLRASSEWGGKGQQQKAGAKTRIEHGPGCVLWRPSLFTEWRSLDVPHTRSPEPRFTPGGTSGSHMKGKKKIPPCL